MLRSILFIILTLTVSIIFAQALNESQTEVKDPYKKRGFIGLNAGLSIPFGKFSNDLEDDIDNGFAQNGFNISFFDIGYKVTKSLAVRAIYFNNSNTVDYEQLRRSRSKFSGLNYISAEGSNYEVNGILIGLSAIKSHKDFDLGINFMMGLSNVHIPYIILNYRDSINNELVVQKFSPVTQFSTGFSVGADLRVHLNSYLDFTSSVKYVIFLQNFRQDFNIQGNTGSVEFDLSYEFISPTIGLAYRFGDEK